MAVVESLEHRVMLSRAWYVAATGGNDAFAGTLAQPLHTIQRAATLAQPGDIVYVRGGVYHETVAPPRSGTSAAPITFAAYGSEKVAIDGADPITSWTRYATSGALKSVYSATQSWDMGDGNNQVFVDWQAMNEARYPNSSLDQSRPATAAVSSVYSSVPGLGYAYSDTATIWSTGLPGAAGSWVGATVHIGAGQDWVVQTGKVVNSTVGSLTFAYQHLTNYETPVAGNRFYVTGKFQALDAAGEWYRDPNTGKLYLWTPAGNSPALHTVEAKHRLFAFDLSGRSYINVRNIHIFAASINTSATSTHNTITGLVASYVSNAMLNPVPWDGHSGGTPTGIVLAGSFNVLQNSTIQYSSGDGVLMAGNNNTVQNCIIHDVDTSGADFAGIDITGAHQQALSNTIYNTGRDGILDSLATAAKILRNTIHDVGFQTTDLGGIYDHGTDSGGTEIAYNTIYNVRTGGFGGCGIYLDNGSAHYLVHDNVISNTNLPIKLNPPSYSNTVYNNRINGIVFANQSSGGGTPAASAKAYASASAKTTILGTLGGFTSAATGINDLGQVVGATRAANVQPGFLYSGGVMSSIGTLGGSYSIASAINATGQIVGASLTAGGGQRVAFLRSGSTLTSLGVLAGDVGSAAAALNNKGQIVGVSYAKSGVGHAFLYAAGKMTALGTLGGAVSQAFGINDAGQVVGASTIKGDYNAHAFLYAGGAMRDLGTLGGNSSYALAINASGLVVGAAMNSAGAFHAFLYGGGVMRDLGTLAGYKNAVATGIDAAGDVVGYAYNTDISGTHAFLYHAGKMIDLNTLLPANTGWVLNAATGINNKNQIVGSASDSVLEQRGFVVTLPG